MDNKELRFNLNTDQPLIARGVPSQRVLEIALEAPVAAQQNTHPPLNLALVLDRSGSMSGEKLEYVKRAAVHVLDLLQEQDRVALVAYDDEISLLSPSVPVTAENRVELKRQISRLEAGASTNLSGGWLAGCQEIAATAKSDSLNRALLLTDGLANAGITDLEELAQHAKELSRRGVSTSTFGVGEGFNEHLLEAMANQGGGNFYYIASPSAIPELFQREFKELAAVTAREVRINLIIPAHVHAQVLGGWQMEQKEGNLTIFVGSLYAAQHVDIYLKLLMPQSDGLDRLEFHADLTASDENAASIQLHAEIVFEYASLQTAESAPKSMPVLERFAAVDLAETATQALKLERMGKNDRAGQILKQSIAANAPFLPAAQVDLFDDMAERMKRGMAENDRKSSHYAAYNQKRGKEK